MPIYTVTFCAQDREAGSNPLWHSCLLLSCFDETTKKLEVVDNWGFYGLPSTAAPDSLVRRAKIKMKIDVDFTSNHGMLRHEDMRFLDLGRGLHGVTFELTEEKFKELRARCSQTADAQDQAIKQIAEEKGFQAKSPEKTRIYPYEHVSDKIYAIEKARAAEEKRSSRLKPFNVEISLTLWGPSLNNSKSCKSQALDLLEGTLTPQQLARITENGAHRNIPRWSGKMETIFLHSSGPVCEFKKPSGEVTHYRDKTDSRVKLHWTIPPQEIETLSGETRNLFKVHDDHCDTVKNVVRQLQTVEWFFRNVALPNQYLSHREKLIDSIKEHYESFAEIAPKKAKSSIDGWTGYTMSLFTLPRDEDEKLLIEKMTAAENLINSLYTAIVDDWKIENVEDDDLEALAAYLPIGKKKELLSILGRSYVGPVIDDNRALKLNASRELSSSPTLRI